MLDKIIAHKEDQLLSKLASATAGAEPPPSTRSLRSALLGSGPGFIMECKKASPSRGTIRHDYDPTAVASVYCRHANAISVLADERFFEGSMDHVRAVSRTVNIPVLCKEFILHPFQVVEARSYGADAVLIMMSILDDETAGACMDQARDLNLDALVEVRDESELERALKLGASIVGINNRDLATLKIDLAATENLAGHVPAHVALVAESGIMNHGDVRRLAPLVDGFLVGSSLMAGTDIEFACRELVHGPVKICGLTSPEDALAAAATGASMGGLVFADGSSRRVSLDAAKKICGTGALQFVGVFVDALPEVVADHAEQLGLAAVQLHGDEDANHMSEVRRLLGDSCSIWKALRVKDQVPSLRVAGTDKVLLDTHKPGARGGTGEAFDWTPLADKVLSGVVLAGGIGPDNVAQAASLGAFALDVSSGVEESPGVKSTERMIELFDRMAAISRSGS